MTQAARRQGRACPAVLWAPRASSPLRGSPLLPPAPPLQARDTGRSQDKGLSGVVRAVPPPSSSLGRRSFGGQLVGSGRWALKRPQSPLAIHLKPEWGGSPPTDAQARCHQGAPPPGRLLNSAFEIHLMSHHQQLYKSKLNRGHRSAVLTVKQIFVSYIDDEKLNLHGLCSKPWFRAQLSSPPSSTT